MNPLEETTTLERSLIAAAQRSQLPINGSIELLPLCNMNCDMCYVRLSRSEMEQQGRLRTPEEWISVAKEMQKAGVLFLLLTGGEPLLYPGFKEVYLAIRKLGMYITINTNATLIDEEWVEFFKKYPPRRFNITLYGSTNEIYSRLCHYPEGFDKATRGILLLKEAGLPVKISISCAKNNRDDIPNLVNWAKEHEFPMTCDTYMMPAVRERTLPFTEQSRLTPQEAARIRVDFLRSYLTEDDFREFVATHVKQIEEGLAHPERIEVQPRIISCLAGSCSFTINWQGQMRPCVISSYPTASVFDHSFEEAWKEIRRKVGEITTCEECSICAYRTLCKTCGVASLLEEGDNAMAPKYLCEYARESYRLIQTFTTKSDQ